MRNKSVVGHGPLEAIRSEFFRVQRYFSSSTGIPCSAYDVQKQK